MLQDLKSLTRRYRYLLLATLVAAAAVAFYYFLVWVPDNQASAYVSRVNSGARSMKMVFAGVSETTNKPLFNDQDISLSDKLKQSLELEESSIAALSKLNEFGADVIRPVGFGFGADHRDAVALQAKVHPVVSQSRDALAEYTNMNLFLVAYYGAQSELTPLLQQRRPANPESTALNLREYARQIQQQAVPSELNDTKGRVLDVINQAAAELDAGTNQYAQVQASNNAVNDQLFALIGSNSYTINNVRQLPEKLQSIGY